MIAEKGLAEKHYYATKDTIDGNAFDGSLRVENGVFCFADILGYSSILEKNDLDYCISLINDVFTQIPSQVSIKLKGNDEKTNDEIKNVIFRRVKYLIVSDSVLIFFNLDDIEPRNKEILHGVFVFYVKFFIAECFKKGIAVRASIGCDPYYIKDYVFASKSIPKTYELADALEFSGLAIRKETFDQLKDLFDEKNQKSKLIEDHFFPYIAPTKNGEQDLYIFKWFGNNLFRRKCIRQTVFESFHKHKKSIISSVLNKIEKTENTIRYLICSRK